MYQFPRPRDTLAIAVVPCAIDFDEAGPHIIYILYLIQIVPFVKYFK